MSFREGDSRRGCCAGYTFAESDFMTDEFREGDFRAFWGFVILGAVIFLGGVFWDLLLGSFRGGDGDLCQTKLRIFSETRAVCCAGYPRAATIKPFAEDGVNPPVWTKSNDRFKSNF